MEIRELSNRRQGEKFGAWPLDFSTRSVLPREQALVQTIVLLLALAAQEAFLEKHCFDCHGGGSTKGGLELDRLSNDLNDPQTLRRWTLVHDRVRSGEMPPRNRPQPTTAEREAYLGPLSRSLVEADRRRTRPVVRRINRVEYENSVRQLLGISVDLRDLLPQDGSAQGFDSVGDALAASSELVEAYLQAAETAIDAAFGPERKPEEVHLKFPLSRDVKNEIGGLFRQVDDGVALFNSSYSPSAVRSFLKKPAGTYRIRIHARAFQSEKPVTLCVYAGDVITHILPHHLVGHWDIPPGPMTVVEFEDRFGTYDTFHPKPYGTVGSAREKCNYPGPGLVIGEIEIDGPLEAWPPTSRVKLLGGVDSARGTVEDARAILAGLLPLAYRRPTTEAEVEPFVGLTRKALERSKSFPDALRVGLKALLCSPGFLFLASSSDDFALAARLSTFLWSSLPDEALRERAARGELHDPSVLRAETERMLRDPKAAAFTKNFAGQWLGLREIDFTAPDEVLYPEFDELLQVSMVRETELTFRHVLDDDLSLLNFVDSDWTFLNARLAAHYGIPGVEGQAFRKVKLPAGSVRGGLLTQASVLKVSANGTNTSPVLRGAWVLDRILGKPAPPPPAGVPAIEPDIRGTVTLREQLAKHRTQENCAVCHRRIDPPGFALESFDVIGAWRDWYRTTGPGERVNKLIDANANVNVRYRKGLPVDPTGALADGRKFGDIREYKKMLLEEREQIARGLAEKLLTYGLGRGLGFSDRAAVEAIVSRVAAKDFGFRTLLHEVVQSETFRRP
jgi:mono/diheme cytochrome c family protein